MAPAETRLEVEAGLTPDAFCARVRGFVDWLIDLVETDAFYGRLGWLEHLEAYVWDDRRWRETIILRERLQTRLAEGDPTAVADLMEWAHMDDMDPEEAMAILESRGALNKIDGGSWEELGSLPARRVASTSKVHSMGALDSWSIYDSRVANALAYAIDCWWRTSGGPREDAL